MYDSPPPISSTWLAADVGNKSRSARHTARDQSITDSVCYMRDGAVQARRGLSANDAPFTVRRVNTDFAVPHEPQVPCSFCTVSAMGMSDTTCARSRKQDSSARRRAGSTRSWQPAVAPCRRFLCGSPHPAQPRRRSCHPDPRTACKTRGGPGKIAPVFDGLGGDVNGFVRLQVRLGVERTEGAETSRDMRSAGWPTADLSRRVSHMLRVKGEGAPRLSL